MMKRNFSLFLFCLSFSLRLGFGEGNGIDERNTVDIPFLITNLNPREVESNGIVTFSSLSTGPSAQISLLRDVRKHEPKAFIATLIKDSNEFKELVTKYILDEYKFENVMYWIPGMQVRPDLIISLANQYNSDSNNNSLIIPFIWKNAWFFGVLSYPVDRTYFSPRAAEALEKSSDLFTLPERSYSQNLLLVSQGNFIFQMYASILAKKRETDTKSMSTLDDLQIFENIYMLAADDRYDIFSAEFNPKVAELVPQEPNNLQRNLRQHFETERFHKSEDKIDSMNYETQENGGYDMAQLVKQKIYVVYNIADVVLQLRQFGLPKQNDNPTQAFPTQALGHFGAQAKALAYSDNTYFPEKVSFVDFSCLLLPWLGHDYVFSPEAYDLYNFHSFPCQDTCDVRVTSHSKYKLIEDGTCETQKDENLIHVSSMEECLSAALALGIYVKSTKEEFHSDLMDGCSIKDGILFWNGVDKTCNETIGMDHWSYTGCHCSTWFPCICKVEG